MPDLKNEKDRSKTSKVGERGGSFIKLEEGHNFILLLSSEYKEGFDHWIKIGDAKPIKRSCAGGVEGGGWVPDECPACGLALEQYDLKKEATDDGDKKLAEDYNKKGNELRAQYSAVFPAVKFGVLVEKDPTTKKKKYTPDYDEFTTGVLRLTSAQMKKLINLIEDSPAIESGGELTDHVLDFVKVKEGEKKFAELSEIRINKKTFNKDLGLEDSDIPDVSNEFKEADDLEKIINNYRNGEEEEEEEYIEEDLEERPKKKSKGSIKASKKAKKNRKEEEDDEEF